MRLIEPLEKRLALSGDPIVTVDTNFGNFQIELLPSAAPQTVANFLNYVESGAYTDTIFHRSVQPSASNPGNIGIIQAGGFTSSSATFSNVSQFQTITAQSPIPLEYNLANASGTIAMARTSDPNSATDEFFINDVDNSTTLGQSNGGGYAVFGKILGNGMQVVNQIAALPISTNSSLTNTAFAQLPVGASNKLAQITSITLDSVDGTVFSDTNANGTQNTGEAGVAGRTVFVDVDHTGKVDSSNPSATTDANGNYTISGVPAGTYTVREVLPTGYGLSTSLQTITVAANQTASGVNFGEIAPSITGTVFNDTNDNGTLDSGETGVAGRIVFINKDGTGKPDSSNPQTTTDANGKFGFAGLAAGSYTVEDALPNGYTLSTSAPAVTVTAGQTTTGVNFGELVPSIVGTVFTDTNDNGQVDGGEGGVAGRVVFLNNDGTGSPTNNPHTTTDASGNFAFPRQPAGTYKVEEQLPANVTLSTATATAGVQSVTVTAGQTTKGIVFGEIPSIAGTVFTDVSGSGTFVSTDPGVAGRTVFLDIDNTHKPDATNLSTTTDANGNFTFTGLAAGTYAVEEVLPNHVTASATAPAVVVTAGHVATANLGELPSITGMAFTDNNGNGIFDTGDTALANHTIIANVDGTGQLDANNPSAITDAHGNYALTGVPTDKPYTIEDITSTGATLGSTSVQVIAGTISKNINLAEAPHNSSISGTLFSDLNLNGKFDSGEPVIAGRVVFLNNDGTGQPDANNPSTTTAADGTFSFTGLAPGSYTVDEVVTPDHGVTLTTGSQTVTVGANQTQTANLGDALTSTLAPLPIAANLPINTSNQTTAYIDGVYEHLLGRAATSADISFWTPKLANATSRATLATSVWNSPEHRTLELDQFYRSFLNRAPDPQGQSYWLNAFTQSWGTEKNVIATFVTSPEYQNLHSSAADYVQALYNDLDLRPADATGLNNWETALSKGQSRLQVAFAFIDGKEANGQLVNGYYSDFLHRAADAAGSQTWINALTNGTASIEDVAVKILATDEYFGVVGAKSGS